MTTFHLPLVTVALLLLVVAVLLHRARRAKQAKETAILHERLRAMYRISGQPCQREEDQR